MPTHFSVTMRDGDNLAQHAQEGGRYRVIKRRHARVVTIDSVEVLRHVVGADAKEIHLVAEVIDDVAYRRHLHR